MNLGLFQFTVHFAMVRSYIEGARRVWKNPNARRLIKSGARYAANAAADYIERQTVTSANRPVARPKRKRPAEQMSRRNRRRVGRRGGRKFFTMGRFGRRFGRKGLMRRVSRALTDGVVNKVERSFNVSDSNCVYLGHHTAGAGLTFYTICQAVTRLFAKRARQDFTNFDTPMGGPNFAGNPKASLRFCYRTTVNGTLLTSDLTITPGATWLTFSNNMADKLMLLMVGEQYFELYSLNLTSLNTATTEMRYDVTLYCKDLYVSLDCKSVMSVQNRTEAENGADDEDEDANNIANNPLTGKMYTGVGYIYPFNYQSNFSGAAPVLRIDPEIGYMTFEPTLSSLPVDMIEAIKKPPPYKSFSNLTGNKAVKLNPGQIRKSYIRVSYSHSLQVWCNMFLSCFRVAGQSVNVIDQDACATLRFGKSVLFGLEKCISVNSTSKVNVAFEVNQVCSGVANYRGKLYCAPIVDLL